MRNRLWIDNNPLHRLGQWNRVEQRWSGIGTVAKQRLTAQLAERDGNCCCTCGCRTTLEIDHLVAMRDGGSSEVGNLRLVCRVCHVRKTAQTRRCRRVFWSQFE